MSEFPEREAARERALKWLRGQQTDYDRNEQIANDVLALAAALEAAAEREGRLLTELERQDEALRRIADGRRGLDAQQIALAALPAPEEGQS